jgi:hypothetical protein
MRGLRPYQWFQTTRSPYGGSIEDKWWQFHFIAFGVGKEQCHYDPCKPHSAYCTCVGLEADYQLTGFDPNLFGQFDPSPQNRDIKRYNPQEPPIHLPHNVVLTPNSQTGRRTRANSSGSSGQGGSGSSQSGPQPGQAQYTPSTSISSPLSARGNQSSSPGENGAATASALRLEKENAVYQTDKKRLEERIAALEWCLHTVMANVTQARDIIQRNDGSQGNWQYSPLYQLLSDYSVEDDVRQFVGTWFRANISPAATLLSDVLESHRSLERPNQQQNS